MNVGGGAAWAFAPRPKMGTISRSGTHTALHTGQRSSVGLDLNHCQEGEDQLTITSDRRWWM